MAPRRTTRDPHPARRARRTVGAVSIASTLGLVAGLGLGGRTAGTTAENGAGAGSEEVPFPEATPPETTTGAVLEAAPGTPPPGDPFADTSTTSTTSTSSPPTTSSATTYPSVVPPPPPPVTVSDGS